MNLEGKNVVLVAYHLHSHAGYRPTIMHRFLLERRSIFSSYVCLAADWDHFSKTVHSFPDEPQVKTLQVPNYRRNVSLRRIWSYAVFAWKIFRSEELKNADLVIVCVPPNVAAVPVLLRMRYRKKPWVIDVVDLWPDAFPLARFPKTVLTATLGIPWSLSRNIIYKGATRLLSHCKFFLDHLGRTDDSTAVFLPLYQTCSEAFEETSRRGPLAQELSLCVLGSINHVLDVDSLLRIADEFHRRGRSLRIEILGAGESKDRLVTELLGREVRVVDHGVSYDPTLKAKILTRCHFGYNGYRSTTAIGITYKSIDFASYGCPLLNSVQGDLKSFVQARGCGLHYEPGTEDILSRKLLALNDDEIDKMSRAVRKLATDLFRKESFDRKLEEVLESL